MKRRLMMIAATVMLATAGFSSAAHADYVPPPKYNYKITCVHPTGYTYTRYAQHTEVQASYLQAYYANNKPFGMTCTMVKL